LTQQVDGLVRGDAAGDAEDQLLVRELMLGRDHAHAVPRTRSVLGRVVVLHAIAHLALGDLLEGDAGRLGVLLLLDLVLRAPIQLSRAWPPGRRAGSGWTPSRGTSPGTGTSFGPLHVRELESEAARPAALGLDDGRELIGGLLHVPVDDEIVVLSPRRNLFARPRQPALDIARRIA